MHGERNNYHVENGEVTVLHKFGGRGEERGEKKWEQAGVDKRVCTCWGRRMINTH